MNREFNNRRKTLSSTADLSQEKRAGFLYATPVKQELAAVETMLADQMRSKVPYVDALVRYGCLLGGKRLRPILLLLVAKSVGEVTSQHILLATVVEMIHTATLVHDDVLDAATMRRHCPTVNDRWDTEASILLGDFLFTHAFYLASTLDSTWACRLIGETTNKLCEGEIRQKGNQGKYDISEAEYLAVNEAKTAALCACACRLGMPELGGVSGLAEKMEAFGRCLGQAFQIVDDLLDVVGVEAETGKSLGTDLQHQKATLPLIHLWQQVGEGQRHELRQIMQGPVENRVSQLGPLLAQHQSIEYARQKALEFASQARQCLQGLPSNPAAEMLTRLPEFVLDRSR